MRFEDMPAWKQITIKVVFTIFLAVLTVWLFGCGHSERSSTTPIDVSYLRHLYSVYNEIYLENRIEKNPSISMKENSGFMADTFCEEDGSCVIHFNPKYVAAQRVADLTLLHEMCHVKTWKTDVYTFGGETLQADHGRVWRSCMLELDQVGAFREIVIDNYREKM